MKHTTTVYEVGNLVQIEVTRYPRTRSKKISFVVAGEETVININDLRSICEVVGQIKKDLKL